MLFYLARGCPNCGGIISDERLSQGLPCVKCLPDKYLELNFLSFADVVTNLVKLKKLKGLKAFAQIETEVALFVKAFQEMVGTNPTSLQIGWAKRLFLGESFAIVAPTGTGKTTFGLISALLNKDKTLIIVPTRVLVTHLTERIKKLMELSTAEDIRTKRILPYTGSAKEKEVLDQGNFDIFICTQAFFHRHFELLKKLDFSLIFVDDVDSFLKTGKNVEELFYLLGFSSKEIALALKREKDEEDYHRLEKIKEKHSKVHKRLLVSSATLKPKTSRAILFQNLLGFEVTRFVSTLRKVKDVYLEVRDSKLEKLTQKALDSIRVLGSGGLIFVEESFGRNGVEWVTNFLKENGLEVISYLDVEEEELLQLIKEGKVEVAVGLSHLSNPLLRGLDLPEVLRYVLFLGVPRYRFPLTKGENPLELPLSIQFLYNLLIALMPLFEDEERFQSLSFVNYLRKYITLKEENLAQYEGLQKKVGNIREFLINKLSDPNFMEKLRTSEEVFLEVEEGRYYVVVGNAQVYLQGSGRVSRLTAKGLLPGISLLLVDNAKAFQSLKRRLRFFIGDEPEFQEVDFEELAKIDKRIREERKNLEETSFDFKNYLIIVESPHKAKTIASFFGKPSKRRIKNLWVYEIPIENTLLSVCASMGHILNLSRKEGIFGVLEEKDKFLPLFDTIKILKEKGEEIVDEIAVEGENLYDKGELIDALRRLAFCATEIYIASDPDSEGEKIAYDLYINLRPFQRNIKRMDFHEVTPRAFLKALKEAGEINLNRVRAQLARRVADRWVGFSLSRELWKAFGKKNLSAGRVQTPVLGWIIKRAEEAQTYKYRLSFTLGEYTFSLDIEDGDKAKGLLEELPELKVLLLEEREEELFPPPPYTTDTILEDAYSHFRFSTSYTMELLQELFELGLITYHRTDSTRVSETGRYQVAKPYIEKNLEPKLFLPREWSKEGAHEAIRPTNPWDAPELKMRVAHGLISFKNTKDSLRIYDLIFRRFMASQCAPLKVKKGVFLFQLPSYEWQEILNTEIIRDGFNLLWKSPPLFKWRQGLKPEKAELHRIPKVFLYNQGSLIQEMKKKGLGRPSTYAEIVSTLLQRYYVYELKNGSLVPTSLGKKVYAHLNQRFHQFISEEFTRELEDFMDAVEKGERYWEEICKKLKDLVMNSLKN
ncbi:MAG: reverse gyrase [Caldimicrobium sp.]|nr:reverse gyrase [Caldimicrobium sp.]MCX7873050.1 reverse gyrase [Caldimicrobium sp.]MDW8094803.1 reverse gyrase [Caldimicrobium sp.]